MSMNAQVYHKVSTDALTSIFKEGLQHGSKGEHSHEDHAEKTNAYLDERMPVEFKDTGLSRRDNLYCYLLLDGHVSDVETGAAVPTDTWRPEEGKAVLRLDIDPTAAYVGDLDVYDGLAEAIEAGRPEAELEAQAHWYWQTVLRLDKILKYYELADRGLQVMPGALPGLPRLLGRVEVLLTRSVPPECIQRV
ncbi:hypothetical protein JNJ66_01425 [Candidatus Saccharibacteria bacterium]|nr:hypothetical protein [Candidatus Saccharibacteria bacterium]